MAVELLLSFGSPDAGQRQGRARHLHCQLVYALQMAAALALLFD